MRKFKHVLYKNTIINSKAIIYYLPLIFNLLKINLFCYCNQFCVFLEKSKECNWKSLELIAYICQIENKSEQNKS